nr:MAG TPA: hypothetical protein [Caudoviricetes sp.]
MVHIHKIKRAGNHQSTPTKTPLYNQNESCRKHIHKPPQKPTSKIVKITLFRFPL